MSEPRRKLELFEATGETTSEGRALFRNSEGGVSSELSITIEDVRINGGMPTNIPSIFSGRILTTDEAIRKIIEAGGRDPETGRVLLGFKSIDEAVAAAKKRSNSLRAR